MMRAVAIGKNARVCDIPENWAEAETMINKAIRQSSGRGKNGEIQSVCARIAFGLTCNQTLTADPTTALAYLIQRICQRKGAGLER